VQAVRQGHTCHAGTRLGCWFPCNRNPSGSLLRGNQQPGPKRAPVTKPMSQALSKKSPRLAATQAALRVRQVDAENWESFW